MWRYNYWDWKDSVEDYSKTIDIKTLKERWYLDKWMDCKKWLLHWEADWKNNWNISVEVNKSKNKWFFRVSFTQTNKSWERKKLDYKIQLVTTTCNYGWVRRWFLCPCTWNRCSILYLQSNWIFASRKTLDLCYDIQKQSKKSRTNNNIILSEEEIKELRKEIKYPFRNWKPTRKYRRLLRIISKMPNKDELMGKI